MRPDQALSIESASNVNVSELKKNHTLQLNFTVFKIILCIYNYIERDTVFPIH